MGDIIPSLVDGLKESERILLYCALKRHSVEEVELEHFVRDTYTFKPREKYVISTRVASLVRMSQYAGTNNINLFLAIGDFGRLQLRGVVLHKIDRLFHGDLMVKLDPVARLLFRKEDDRVTMDISNGCTGCGRVPTFLLPIIPLILVNGTDCNFSGGYRSYVPQFRAKDVIGNLRCLLKKVDMKPMIPWFEGFKGTVEACEDDDSKFIVSGAIGFVDHVSKTVDVIELPIGMLAQDYVKLLEDGSIPNKGFVDLSDYHYHSLHIRISLWDEDCTVDSKCLLEKLKLTSIISLNDMYLIDISGMTWKYSSPLEVICRFYDYRLQFFCRRKDLLVEDRARQLKELDKEIDESCSASKRYLNVIKSIKGKLLPNFDALFEGFTDQDLRKVEEATMSVHHTDEAPVILTTLLSKIVTFMEQLHGNDNEEPPIRKVNARSSYKDPYQLLQTVKSQINKLKIVLEALKKLRSRRSDLQYEFDELNQATSSSMWLDDLQELEDYLTEHNYFSLAGKEESEAFVHLTGGMSCGISPGKKRKRHLFDHDIADKSIACDADFNLDMNMNTGQSSEKKI